MRSDDDHDHYYHHHSPNIDSVRSQFCGSLISLKLLPTHTHTHTHTCALTMSHPLLLIATPLHLPWQSPQWHWAVEMSEVKFTLTLKWRSPWATVKVSAMATAGWYRRWGGTYESPLQILHVALTASSDCSLSLSLSHSFFFFRLPSWQICPVPDDKERSVLKV